MDCRDAHRQIDELALDPLGEPCCALRAHVRRCDACRELLERTERIRAALRPGRDDEAWRARATVGLRESLSAEPAAGPPRAAGVGRRLAWVASVAMALLGGAWGVWLAASGREASPDRPAAHRVEPVSLWTREGLCARPGSPGDDIALSSDSVYCLLRHGGRARVARLDRATGGRLWVSDVPSVGYLLAVPGGVCCVSARRGGVELVALDGRDGRARWRVASGRPRASLAVQGLSPPRLVDANRICWVVHGRVRLIDAFDGEELWTREELPAGQWGAASVWRGKLLIAGAGGLVCLDVDDGAKLWRIERPPSSADLAGPTRLAVFGRWAALASGRRVALLDLSLPEVVWERSAGEVHHVGLDAHRVYVRGRSVRCLDRGTGEALWDRPAKGCGPITIRSGRAYFVDVDRRGSLLAVRADSGEVAWHVEGLPSCDAYLPAGEATYLKTRDGVLHALALAD